MRAIGIVAAVLAYGHATSAFVIPAASHEQDILHKEDFRLEDYGSSSSSQSHTPKLIIEDHDGTPGTVRPRRLQGRFLHISGMFRVREKIGREGHTKGWDQS